MISRSVMVYDHHLLSLSPPPSTLASSQEHQAQAPYVVTASLYLVWWCAYVFFLIRPTLTFPYSVISPFSASSSETFSGIHILIYMLAIWYILFPTCSLLDRRFWFPHLTTWSQIQCLYGWVIFHCFSNIATTSWSVGSPSSFFHVTASRSIAATSFLLLQTSTEYFCLSVHIFLEVGIFLLK